MVTDLQTQTENTAEGEKQNEENLNFDLKNPKVKLILKGASKVFLNEGYDVATTDMIARTAGVSKATLYVYFKSKDALLQAMVKYETAKMLPILDWRPESGAMDIVTVLKRIALEHTHFVLSESANKLYRLVIAQSTRFPEIGMIFYDAGPRRFREQLADIFEAAVDQGLLEIPDVLLAANHFLSLTLGDLPYFRLIELPEPSEKELELNVENGLHVFLKAYSPSFYPKGN